MATILPNYSFELQQALLPHFHVHKLTTNHVTSVSSVNFFDTARNIILGANSRKKDAAPYPRQKFAPHKQTSTLCVWRVDFSFGVLEEGYCRHSPCAVIGEKREPSTRGGTYGHMASCYRNDINTDHTAPFPSRARETRIRGSFSTH